MTEILEENKDSYNPVSSVLIIDYLKIILSYKLFIIISSIIVTLIVAILVFFVFPPIFYSSGTVKTTGKSSSGLAGMISSSVPDIGGLSDLTSGGSSAKELALYENIILSRRCLEETIIKFDLLNEWGIKYMQDALKNFRDNVLDIKKDKIAGMMEIGIFDVDPKRAQEISDFLIFQLNKINTEMNIQNAKSSREFIESRYNLTVGDLKKAEDSLKNYQDIYGLAPDIQVKAIIQSEVQLEVDIKAEEVKLELLKKILSSDQSEVKQQEAKISSLKNQLSDIQNSTDLNNNLRLKGTPDIVLNSIRLQRNVEIQNKILATLLPLLEQSKIEEKRETPSVIVLDNPNIPDHKVKPKRMTLIIISLFASLAIFSIGSIFYNTFFKKLREHF